MHRIGYPLIHFLFRLHFLQSNPLVGLQKPVSQRFVNSDVPLSESNHPDGPDQAGTGVFVHRRLLNV
jgi:hypothetical protein